ncbi:hypothetical protein [Methanobrevibacter sp.]|uniref:hypothetical protein n=1 Tax=Methanobrevibacter sp. TaxID=66852 RepID=UPI0025E6A393|nr:hypothetical protein [Methanobrevibacter sp.]MBR4447601.1 hypothetical protein [Methanobrevibacter sp.]
MKKITASLLLVLLVAVSLSAVNAEDLATNDTVSESIAQDEAVSIDNGDTLAHDDGNDEELSDNVAIDLSTDNSTTTINGRLVLTDVSTGKVFTKNITVDKVKATYTRYNTTEYTNSVAETINQLLNLAQTHAGDYVVTMKSQNVSTASGGHFDNRNYAWKQFMDSSDKYLEVTGEYGTIWQCNVTIEVEFTSGVVNIDNAKVTLSKNAFTYNGKIQRPTVTVKNILTLKRGRDYTIQWSSPSPKNAGTYTITIVGTGMHTGTVKATYKINKAENPLEVKGKNIKIKFKKLKKKAKKIAASKVIKFPKLGQGTLTYKKVKGINKIKVNKKTGKITIKKGLKGTYKIKVKIKAKGNANYKASAFKTATFKIKIK